jgi:hypothetical protein
MLLLRQEVSAKGAYLDMRALLALIARFLMRADAIILLTVENKGKPISKQSAE